MTSILNCVYRIRVSDTEVKLNQRIEKSEIPIFLSRRSKQRATDSGNLSCSEIPNNCHGLQKRCCSKFVTSDDDACSL